MKVAGVTLETPLSELKGVGVVVNNWLAKLGLETVQDLLEYYPRRWDDYSVIRQIADIHPGLVSVTAKVERLTSRLSFRGRRLSITEAIISDKSGTIRCIWFNMPYLKTQLKEGQTYLFSGKFEFKNNYLSLQSPSFEQVSEGPTRLLKRILSVYPENKTITSKVIRKLIDQVLGLSSQLPDALPASVIASQKLMGYGAAVEQLHQPTSMVMLEAARQRLAFEEMFMLIVTGLATKQEIQTEPGLPIPFQVDHIKSALKELPFTITDAQRKVAWQIFQDLERDRVMNRLLEGDVGSGKTVVALLAAYDAMVSGHQVAFMVPTEILARQHLQTIQKLFGNVFVAELSPQLLIGSTPKKLKGEIKSQLTSGRLKLVVGTHALFSEDIYFDDLALVIIDEQHRFGVAQRRELKTRSKTMPHVLTMTATPIPRSLALVVYGELDVSILDQPPAGRKKTITKVLSDDRRSGMYAEVDALIEQGQQVFIVCPLIDDSDTLGAKSVTAEFDRLQAGPFAHRRIGLIHGKLKADEKDQIMQAFVAGEYHILVATSVIEVGVDVANATTMIIESAERFGLAALHQLRGRVGRSSLQSYCYLLSESENPATLQRLRALERTNDGMRLSQIDLEMRGPGEIYGARQHGLLDLRMANVLDVELITRAQKEAQAFLSSGDMVKYPHIVAKINDLKAITTLD